MLYFLFYFPGDVDAAISRCLLAVSKPTMQFKLFTVVGKVCSEAAEKECWRILYNMWGAEAVLACIAATQHRIIPPLCVLFSEHMCGPKALPWLFIVVNRNLCIDFYEAFFNFWHILLSSCM